MYPGPAPNHFVNTSIPIVQGNDPATDLRGVGFLGVAQVGRFLGTKLLQQSTLSVHRKLYQYGWITKNGSVKNDLRI